MNFARPAGAAQEIYFKRRGYKLFFVVSLFYAQSDFVLLPQQSSPASRIILIMLICYFLLFLFDVCGTIF